MQDYVKIDACLSYMTNAVKEQADQLQLLQYASQAWRSIEMPAKYEIRFCLVEVSDHRASLPSDVKQIKYVGYTDEMIPDNGLYQWVEVDNERRAVFLQQTLMLTENAYINSFRPLYYLGQNRSKLIDRELWCSQCEIGFSVDAKLKCLTIDIPDTVLLIGYYALLKDEDGDFLVPNDPDLLAGLAAKASAMVFRDMADRRMEGTFNREQHYNVIAAQKIGEFKGAQHARNFNPQLHQRLKQNRFNGLNRGHYWQHRRN